MKLESADFDFYGYFHSVGLIADLDMARKNRLRDLFLDLLLLIGDLDPDEKISGLRDDFANLILRYFNDANSGQVDFSSLFSHVDIER